MYFLADESMDDDPIDILIVDDEEAHSALIRRAYKKRGDNVRITVVENLRQAKQFLENATPDVVIADWLLPDGRGTDLLTKEPDKLPYPIVVVTSHGDELMAVDVIKAGAMDFIMKSDVTLTEMPYLVDRTLYQWRKVLEHRCAQVALRESEERLRILFQCAPDGIVLTDPQGTIVDINRAALRTAGLARDDVIGRKFYELGVIDPEQLPGAIEMMQDSSGSVYSEPLQFRVRAPDGDWRTLETRSFPINDRTGILSMTILRDITERKRAEQALAEERNLLRALIDNVPHPIYAKDLDSRFLVGNTPVVRRFGCENADQLIGKSDADFFPPYLAEEFRRQELQVMRSGRPVLNVEHCETAPDGSTKWFLNSKVPLRDAAGRIIGLIGVLNDVTAIKLAEQELALERNQLRTLVDNLPDVTWVKDTESRFIVGNEALARLLGAQKLDTVISKTDYDFHPRQEADRYFAEERNILKTGRPIINRETSYLANDGPKWSLTTKVPLRDAGGNIVGIVGITRDITEIKLAAQELQRAHDQLEDRVKKRTAQLSETNRSLKIEISERKLAEEALRQSQKRQKAILDTTPDIAWLKDREGRYIAVNEPFAEACGLAPDDLIGKTDFDICPADLAQKYARDDAEVISTGARKRLEEPFVDKTKKGLLVETIKTPIYDNRGQIVGTSGIARDVTERKMMERKLRESEKLAVAGRIAAKVAHEINNPLAGIKNSFLLIKDAIPSDHPYYDYVARIDKEISRVTSLVRRMFDLYRPEGQSRQLFCVREVINDVVALLNVTIKQSDVTIAVDVDDGASLVSLPEGMFRQVLFNIICNAVEASSPAQTVTVSARVSDRSLNVAVSDCGHGIPEEIHDRVFEPFFTTKTGFAASGLGLGLAVCKSEIEAMGGSISFESKPDAGTCFYVTIPLSTPTEPKK